MISQHSLNRFTVWKGSDKLKFRQVLGPEVVVISPISVAKTVGFDCHPRVKAESRTRLAGETPQVCKKVVTLGRMNMIGDVAAEHEIR